MSPRNAFSSALEAINMVDVRFFISFLVSLPKEFTKLFLEVIEGYHLSIPESPRASSVLRIDSAEVAACNATVEQCANTQAPVYRMAKAIMKGRSPQFVCQWAPDEITVVSNSLKSESGLEHCEDMIMMILIVVACYLLIKAYARYRCIASRAFKKWQKANVSSLVIVPDPIQFIDPDEFDMPTPKVAPIYEDSRIPYSAHESNVSFFFPDAVRCANQRPFVLDFGSISSMSRNTSIFSLKREWDPRDLLAGMELDFERIGMKLDEMKRDSQTTATVMFAAPHCNVPDLNEMYLRSYHEFDSVITAGQSSMTWVRACITCMGTFKAFSESHRRKALLLNERINECFTFFQTKFGFDETEFIKLIEEFEILINTLPNGGWSGPQRETAREAYKKLEYFLPRKREMLVSFLNECLDTVRQCEELRNCVSDMYFL